MQQISHTGGLTHNSTTSVLREVPVLKAFPAVKGRAKSVSVTTSIRLSVAAAHSYTVYLFKTFGGDAAHWEDRTDNKYQYPSDSAHYLQEGYIKDVLASASFTDTLATGEITKALALTEYGMRCENWAGDIYLAIVSNTAGNLYWGNGTTSTVTLEYNSGIVKYAIDGEYVDCEVYYAVNGEWQQVQPFVASGGAFKEVGG